MNELNVFRREQNEAVPVASVTQQMMVSRQAQEVQAAMVVAKRFPRDNALSMDRVLDACRRRTLAENAVYEYSKGGSTITGPSIRLAEAMAQCWGNIDFGIIELEQHRGESQVMAYAWDLETNTRQSKVFTVPHIRHTQKGDYPLTDPREIYETVANQGARRLRACILGVIPGDVVDAALAQCETTLRSGSKDPLAVRIANMVEKFSSEFGVTADALRGYIGKNVEAFSEGDVVRLGKVYRSLKDGVIGSDYFMDKLMSPPENAPSIENIPATDANGEVEQVDLNDL